MATDHEQELRRAWKDGDLRAVATLALERYGPEILGVMAVQLRSTTDAADAFSLFAEHLGRGLPGFQWRCSLPRGHRVARHAALRWATAGAQQCVPHLGDICHFTCDESPLLFL